MFNVERLSELGKAGITIVLRLGYTGFVAERRFNSPYLEGAKYCGYIVVPLDRFQFDLSSLSDTDLGKFVDEKMPTWGHEDCGITFYELIEGAIVLGFDRLHSWSSKEQSLEETVYMVEKWIECMDTTLGIKLKIHSSVDAKGE